MSVSEAHTTYTPKSELTPCMYQGMDTAPVLIPPSRYPVQSASRISFVQANFLEIWPFEDDSFDFVRIAFAGDSIPEDLWHHVFDEATRVLNKNGWIQCIDDLSIITPPVTSPIQTSASLQRGESKFQSTLPIVSSSAPVLSTLANLEATKLLASDEPEGIEPHTAVQDKLNAFRKALESSRSIRTSNCQPGKLRCQSDVTYQWMTLFRNV